MNKVAHRPGTNRPHGQRPQARRDTGRNVPVPDRRVEGVLFSDVASSSRDGVIEDAVTIKAYNSADAHYCYWGGVSAGWRFNNTNARGTDYVAEVCKQVD